MRCGIKYKFLSRLTVAFICVTLCFTGKSSAQISHNELFKKKERVAPETRERIAELMQSSKAALANGQADEALKTIIDAIRQSVHIGFVPGIDTGTYYFTTIFSQSGYTGKGRAAQVQEVIDLISPYKEHNVYLSWLHDVLAGYFFETGHYAQGLLEYEKALKTLPNDTSRNVQEMMATIYTNLSGAWATLDEEVEARSALEKAENIALHQKNIHRQISVLQHKGIRYMNNKQLDSALYFLSSSYDLSIKYPDKHPPGCRCRQYTVANLCIVLIQMGNPDSALTMVHTEQKELERQLLTLKEKGYSTPKMDALGAFFNYLEGYAYFKKKNYNRAENILLPLLAQVQKEGIEKNESNIHETLAALYANTNRYDKAFYHKEQGMELLNGRSIKKEKSKLLALHHNIEKEKENAERRILIIQRQNAIKERNFWIAALLAGAMLLGVVIITLYRNNRNKQHLQTALITNLQQQQEITHLQAKMEGEEQERNRIAHELHDGIVSQLLSLKLSMETLLAGEEQPIVRDDLRDVTQYLDRATQELRRTAHNLMPDLLLQQGLVQSVAALCEQISNSTRLEVEFQAYGAMPDLAPQITLSLYRIIQELIQNVLKHAEASFLLLQISIMEQLLSITVEDNGKGFDPALSQNGTGLRNIQRRVDLLGGTMDIKSMQNKQTTVYLEFNLNVSDQGLHRQNQF